jgi:hypothetical protein
MLAKPQASATATTEVCGPALASMSRARLSRAILANDIGE